MVQKAGAQPIHPRPPPPDSADARDHARRLQARFERLRLREAPRTLGGHPECDDIVGRLCIWHGDDPDSLPREPSPVTEARARMLAGLDSVALRIPGDAWVFGQRIRYLAEAGRLGEAAGLAAACGLPEAWRCDAYMGFVRHQQGDAQAAEAAFRSALAAMPSERAAQWADVSPLLDRGLRSWLEAQPDSATAAEHLWTLADPLFLSAGNDRWTAHMSRWTYAMSSERTWTPHQMRWGDDLTKVVVRYGWPAAWESSWPRAGQRTGSAVGHDSPGVRRTFPGREVLEPGREAAVHWPESRRGPTAYLPPYLDSLGALDGQIGRFRRPNGVFVVAAAEVPGPAELPEPAPQAKSGLPDPASLANPALPGEAALAGLFLARDGRVAMSAWGAVAPGAAVRLSGLVPGEGTGVVSLEAWTPSRRVAYRLRQGTSLAAQMPGLLALSDLVLLEAAADPRDASQTANVLRGGTVYRGDDSLNVAFEVYGLGPGSQTISFRAWVAGGEGLLSRLARWLRLRGPSREVSVEWEEASPPGLPPLFRVLRLRLPGLDAGDYELTVEVSVPGRTPTRRNRRFVVEPIGAP